MIMLKSSNPNGTVLPSQYLLINKTQKNGTTEITTKKKKIKKEKKTERSALKLKKKTCEKYE